MKRLLSLVALTITLAWVGFIFSNSLDSGIESGQKSSTVHEIVNDVAQSLGAKQEISEATIRTSAHFTEFAVLGVLLCLDVALCGLVSPSSPLSRRHALLCLPLPVGMAIAAIDEWIQYFSPGRAMQFIDVLVDSGGTLCGMLLFFAVFFIIHAIKKRKAVSKS